MIFVIATILALFFLLSLKKPAVSYGIILAVLPTYLLRLKILNIPTTILELLIGVFLLGVLLTHWNKQSWNKISSLKETNWVIGAFLLAAGLSSFFSPEPIKALGQLKAFFVEPVLLFYAALVVFKTKSELDTPLKWLFGAAFLISLFGLVQYMTHLMLPLRFWGYGLEMKRITSIFEYPNALALYLAPLIAFFSILVLKGVKLAGKYSTLIMFIVMALALILTYSRGAWLSIVVAAIVLAIQQSSRFSIKKWGIAAAVILLIASPLLFTRVKSTFRDGSSSERLELYKVAGQKIIESPILGNGLYGFRTTLENSDYSGEVLNYPHNIILNFWLETGLIGVLSFFLLFFLAMSRYKKSSSALKVAAAFYLLTMVTHGMVDAPYFKNDLSVLFWFVLSIFYIEE
ncbi:MAG TPA: O-antigen ligase family protein [Candidatus Binatia bacterium]|nr:O-antigen ligase family protein [Candidatus Binatia bacterium]